MITYGRCREVGPKFGLLLSLVDGRRFGIPGLVTIRGPAVSPSNPVAGWVDPTVRVAAQTAWELVPCPSPAGQQFGQPRLFDILLVFLIPAGVFFSFASCFCIHSFYMNRLAKAPLLSLICMCWFLSKICEYQKLENSTSSLGICK